MSKQIFQYFLVIVFISISYCTQAQEIDSLENNKISEIDSIFDNKIINDSIPNQDSLEINSNISKDAVDQIVNYEATDSIMLSMKDQMVYLFGSGKLETEGMELTAGRIEIDMDKSELKAFGYEDSTGLEVEKPAFIDGDQSFSSENMTYNFKTKKGVVKGVITEQADGYVHGTVAKIHPNKEIHMIHGKYTTCDANHPHFYIELTKAKVIPKEKIIAGPVYFVILDVPLYPIGLPYGFFPNTKNKASGILMPKFDNQERKGFGLQQGGYYWALNDYFDLTLMGDIYSSGSWGTSLATNFKKRYKFSGKALLQYSKVKYDEKAIQEATGEYTDRQSFKVTASYNQDTKANPLNNFSLNVSFDRGGFSKLNAQNINEFVNSTNTSSLSYRRTFRNLPFNLSASANVVQNLADSTTNLKLPTVSFNMQRIYPFKRKKAIGESKWYEDIGLTLNTNFDNSVDIEDSLLFTNEVFKQMKYGFKYSAPVSTSFNIFKYVTASPTLSYTGRIYPDFVYKSTNHYYDTLGVEHTEIIETDIKNISHNFDFSFSMPFSTKLYGLVLVERIKLKPVKNMLDKMGLIAVRHVASPSIGYSYKPDFGTDFWGYYVNEPNDTLIDSYCLYENGIFGYPPTGEQQSMTFSLGNNFEMKVKNKKDTVNNFSKIKILDRLNFSSSYNFAADSMNLAPVSISGGTTLFGKITINLSGSLDPYTIDDTGQRINTFEYDASGKIGRFTAGKISMNTSLDAATFNKLINFDKTESYDDDYSYLDIPWSLTLNYSFNYYKKFDKETLENYVDLTQTAQFSFNFTPTPKWSFALSSGWDFDKSKITSTSLNLTRDLHCWDMSLNIIPFGTMKSYTFMLGIKSSVFDGVDYKRENHWEDNPEY